MRQTTDLMKNLTILTLAAYLILISWVAFYEQAEIVQHDTAPNQEAELTAVDTQTYDAQHIEHAKKGCKYRY